MCAENGLDIALGVVGYGLELIYGYDARLVCFLQIVEYFAQCGLGHLDVADAQSPFRLPVDVEGDGAAQRAECVNKPFPYLAAFRL